MADWGPVVIAVVLFVLLSPGLLFQLPGKHRLVEFGNMQTNGLSILVHTIIFFGLTTIFLIALGVHIYTGWSLLQYLYPLPVQLLPLVSIHLFQGFHFVYSRKWRLFPWVDRCNSFLSLLFFLMQTENWKKKCLNHRHIRMFWTSRRWLVF